MSKKVMIVDYGVGNLLSVGRAFEHCGATVVLAENANALVDASRLVLPGVGAFGDCVNALRAKGLDQAVLEHVAKGRLLMGICVGMQMLLDGSEEFGWRKGLGIIPGIVKSIPNQSTTGQVLKVPHVGWSRLELPEMSSSWEGSVLRSLSPGISATYFVHSYSALPLTNEHRVADAIYGGHRLTAVIENNNVFGVQFHPEKSGKIGLNIIENFLNL